MKAFARGILAIALLATLALMAVEHIHHHRLRERDNRNMAHGFDEIRKEVDALKAPCDLTGFEILEEER